MDLKRHALIAGVFVVGVGLGATVPFVAAAPRVGDAKFENQFIKKFQPSAEKPLVIRVDGVDLNVVGVAEVEDDFVGFLQKSKDPAIAWVRMRDISIVREPGN